jgi:Tol biopolymer transport system component
VDNKHTLYFGTGDGRIMESKYKNGAHQKPVNLAEVYSNPSISGGSPFINPTGDYLIFSKENDLFIAFRKTADTWSEAIRFDESINSTSNETCPIVSPDGRYLFFNRDWDIYWVLIEDRIRSMQSQITKKRNNNHP